MNNIYIQEPSTLGKVLLKTTVGDLDIELWSRECPKACRNFIQLCMEGYYNGTIFHRVVKGFIVQGGDPNGDGTGGESIYGQPFKDEFHSRLRYTRRGLVGMANSDVDDNGSQFFFTMAATPELQNKNTLFGKVSSDTVFNMLKLEDGLVDHNERPFYPAKIIQAEILNNPFSDIVPRIIKKVDEKKSKKKLREKGVKNFGLLSFGEEAEEDEQETTQFVQRNAGRAKSMHDVVDDPKLSREVLTLKRQQSSEPESLSDDQVVKIKQEPDDDDERISRIKEKLKSKDTKAAIKENKSNDDKKEQKGITVKNEPVDTDEDELVTYEEEMRKRSAKKKDEIRQEIITLKKQYQKDKKIKDELLEKTDKEAENNAKTVDNGNELIKEFIEEKQKYSELNAKIPKKGASREDFTLKLLTKFRSKLDTLKQKRFEHPTAEDVNVSDKVVEHEIQGDEWLTHTLCFQDAAPVLAKDASTKSDDWYDVYDPRNPLNKRKRGAEHGKSSNTKKNK